MDIDIEQELKSIGFRSSGGVFTPTGYIWGPGLEYITTRGSKHFVAKKGARYLYVFTLNSLVVMDYITCLDVESIVSTFNALDEMFS